MNSFLNTETAKQISTIQVPPFASDIPTSQRRKLKQTSINASNQPNKKSTEQVRNLLAQLLTNQPTHQIHCSRVINEIRGGSKQPASLSTNQLPR